MAPIHQISCATLILVKICTSVWATGNIPQQLCWVVTVLILKGGGEYRGIGLLEPIWKVMERVMDLRLERIKLHDSLHGCLAGRGTGTGIIEAKTGPAARPSGAEAILWCLH